MAQMKVHKQSANLMQLQIQQQEQRKQPPFGICFDIDGVIARGSVPIPAAIKAFHRLVDDRGQTRLPVAFVTNSLNRNADRARQLSTMLGVQVNPDQLIQAQGPLVMFSKLHEKFCLVVGQGQILEIAHDLGFKNVCTVEDIAEAYQLLDVVDHDNRKKIASQGYTEKEFPKIEAVVLLGEPKRWESALQILIDVLRTGGRPNMVPTSGAVEEQLPVVACNMDLQFMHRAAMPRFGHGAFLVCLEALYQKITGSELQYTALVGKPSEITFRYAEHVLTSQARKLGFSEPIKTMYLIGDTLDSDIVGSNLYQRYVDRVWTRHPIDDDEEARNDNLSTDDVIQTGNYSAKHPIKDDPVQLTDVRSPQYYDPDIPASRNVPSDAEFHRATVDKVVPVLVCTGVYRPATKHHSEEDEGVVSEASSGSEEDGEDDVKKVPYHGHRDFPNSAELYRPARLCADVCAAVEYILQHEVYE